MTYLESTLSSSSQKQCIGADDKQPTLGTLCQHCGAPVPTIRRNSSYCCAGCQLVGETLLSHGLEKYYEFIGSKVHSKTIDELNREESYDWCKEEAELSDQEGSYRFLLRGIHCVGCLWILERLSRVLPGVISASLNFSEGALTVKYSPEKVSLQTIAQFLHRLGYPPLPPDRSPEEIEMLSTAQLGVAGFGALNTMLFATSLFQGWYTGIENQYLLLFQWVSCLIAVPVVAYAGAPLFRNAWGSIRSRTMHLDLPLSVALLSGVVVSIWNTIQGDPRIYFDSVCALLFLLLASRWVQAQVLARVRRDARRSWSILPLTAKKITQNGVVQSVSLHELHDGDRVVVEEGERFPVDGILQGEGVVTEVDRAVLTGESLPIPVFAGDSVEAGTLNLTQAVQVIVKAAGRSSRVGKLLTRWSEEGSVGLVLPLTEKVSRWFLWIVSTAAVICFIYWAQFSIEEAFQNTLALLIVTCPCALALGAPLILGRAIAQAAREGILLKGVSAIEAIAHGKKIYLDKTGTLTFGKYEVVYSEPIEEELSAQELSSLAYCLALTPGHPVTHALQPLFSEFMSEKNGNGKVYPGRGVQWNTLEGTIIRLGSRRWHAEEEVFFPSTLITQAEQWEKEGCTLVFFSVGKKLRKVFVLRDTLKPEAQQVIQSLRRLGFEVFLLSGDSSRVVREVGKRVGVPPSHTRGSCTPEEKAQVIADSGSYTLMVGDGVNDLGALKTASVGIGVRGTLEVSCTASEVILSEGTLPSLELLCRGSRRTIEAIQWSLWFAVLYNIGAACLAVTGVLSPFIAALIMPISSLTFLLYAIRVSPFTQSKQLWK